jgi:hypothetical protein
MLPARGDEPIIVTKPPCLGGWLWSCYTMLSRWATFIIKFSGYGVAWLTRLLWEQETAGSNPVTPTLYGLAHVYWRTVFPLLADSAPAFVLRILVTLLRGVWPWGS